MDGILIVNKPLGMTSFDVVSRVRRITGTKKVGHTGTLDPEAGGVLPVCVGLATGCVEFMVEKDKVYLAEMTLGSKTDTQDHTGKVTATSDVKVSKEQVLKVMEDFLGEQNQRPPIYSAIKVGGMKLYELARQGRENEVEIAERPINIYDLYDIETVERDGYVIKVRFRIHCSKGTYIRTLCNDIGEKLGSCGHMSALAREKSGDFSMSDALTLGEIEELNREGGLEKRLLPCDFIFHDTKRISLNEDNIKRYLNGIPIKLYKLGDGRSYDFGAGEYVRIYSAGDIFVGISEAVSDDQGILLKPYKLFIRRDEL